MSFTIGLGNEVAHDVPLSNFCKTEFRLESRTGLGEGGYYCDAAMQ